MGQITLMSGPERRRRWSEDQKLALVVSAFAPGASVAEVARQADICTSQLYRWRQDFSSVSGFAPAVLVDEGPSLAPVLGAASAEPVIIVELSCGARMSITQAASAPLVTAALRALR